MRTVGIVAAVMMTAVLGGCAGPAVLQSEAPPIATPMASTSCPPAGTFVPFSKVMNPGFARDYQGCNISTKATFVGAGLGGYGLPAADLGKDKVAFRAIVPGERIPTGAQLANFATLPKERSDMIFMLKPGDTILLTGGTYLLPYAAFLPVFVANSIERSR